VTIKRKGRVRSRCYVGLVLQRDSNLDVHAPRLRANAKQFNCKTNLTYSLIL